MDGTHLHLLLNHFPIVGTLIGTLILAYAFMVNSRDVKVVACFVIAAMALVAIPVMKTGEIAEEVVESLPGVTKQLIHAHEEAAEVSLWVLLIAGALAAVSLVLHFTKKEAFKYAIMLTLLASVVAFGFMARTGNLGGEIRHTEIRSGGAAATPQNIQGQPADKGVEEHGDGD